MRHGWFLDLISLGSTRVWSGLGATLFSRFVNLVCGRARKCAGVFDWQEGGGSVEQERFLRSSASIFRGYFQTSKLGVPFQYNPPPLVFRREYDPAIDIAIHVRRGDYLDPANRERYGVVKIEDLLREGRLLSRATGGQLIIFTDSPDQIGRELHERPETGAAMDVKILSRGQDPLPPIVEMALMAEFHHLVISNSTFSLWAGRLGFHPKKVVAPWPWFKSGEQPEDILPADWKIGDIALE